MSSVFLTSVLVAVLAVGYGLGRFFARKTRGAKTSMGRLLDLLAALSHIQEKGVSHQGSVNRREFCEEVIDQACGFVGSSRGTVMLMSEEKRGLVVEASRGFGETSFDLILKAGEGVAGLAFESGRPLFVSDPARDPRFFGNGSNPGAEEPFVSVPLLVRSKPIGVLNLHWEAGSAAGRVGEEDLRFLGILAGEAAVMVHNLELLQELEGFYLEMVTTLARAVDSKDSYTHEHSERARSKARALAGLLGLGEAQTRYVEYAALLHDVGKIGIDEAILLKPGKLTAEEYEVMKRHPVIGHKILSPVKYLGPVAEMVLYHQEWFNGQGYPEGRRGEQIPLGSRIVAVIDAWDAMTSDRPYRKALTREQAVSELRHGAGTQFDPRVVEAFLSLESQPAPSPV